MKYLFSNILGAFVFDNQFNLVEEIKFNKIEGEKSIKETETKLKNKYRDARYVPEEKIDKILFFFKSKKYFQRFHSQNLKLTKQKIKESVSEDQLIIQTISNMDEINKLGNVFVKRLREWYSWYLPEFSASIENNEKFTEIIVKKSKKELIKELKIKDSMGADLKKEDVDEMIALAKEILNLYKLKQKHEEYIEKIMKKYCPNIQALAGTTIGAKLIELAKSLKRLAMLPASTVQLLGAEKALFRHIKTGSKSPKYGVIINHLVIQNARKEDKGKASRSLADKLSLCARLDFFKGEFKAPEYEKGLKEKFLK